MASFGNHANMTASASRYHGGSVVSTLYPVATEDVAELYVFHSDGSHGWEHTVNGVVWIPRENPVLDHPFFTWSEIIRHAAYLRDHPTWRAWGTLRSHTA